MLVRADFDADRAAWWAADEAARRAAAGAVAPLFPFSGPRGYVGTVAEALSRVPTRFRRLAVAEFERRAAVDKGDAWQWVAGAAAGYVVPAGLPIDAGADEVRQCADGLAARGYVQGARWRALPIGERRAAVAEWLRVRGAPVDPKADADGLAARAACARWWRRVLRAQVTEAYERAATAGAMVHRRAEVYATDVAVRRRRAMRARNAATLKRVSARAYDADGAPLYVDATALQVSTTLAEASDASVANPAIRRGEMMTRVRGFEDAAREHGHAGYFVTLTAPSRYHRMLSTGEPNPKWDGASTPREAHAYLLRVWARVRAAWKRARIEVYGFRIVEPHHDGTPHWHLLLFADPALRGRFDPARWFDRRAHSGMVGLFGFYALAEDGGEPGAREHRFKVEAVDPRKGDAASYMATYVSKNIDGKRADGESIGDDAEAGGDAIESSERVLAWASAWRIRQFQQVGGPPVGVWRELRREWDDGRDAPVRVELFAAAGEAADAGDWGAFVDAMGGPAVRRCDRPLRVWREVSPIAGRYGQPVTVTRGVRAWGLRPADGIAPPIKGWNLLRTRTVEWRVDVRAARGSRGERPARRSAATAQRATPWTRVNNCTRPHPDEWARRARLARCGPTARPIEAPSSVDPAEARARLAEWIARGGPPRRGVGGA